MKKKGILSNTIASIAFVTVLSQIIALVRESIFAYYYGTGIESDAYVIASQIPVTLFAIISSAINTVILPLYISKKEKKGLKEANSFLKTFIFLFLAIAAIVVLLEEILAVPLVKLFAPSFNGIALTKTVIYSRILFPTVMMTGIISIFTAVYNAEGNFIYPTMSALSQNIILILSMFFFSGKYGAVAAVWGTSAGIFFNMFFILIRKVKIFSIKIRLKDFGKDIKLVIHRVIPITLGVGVAEINRIIDRAIASGLDTGSITALNYSNKLTVVFASLILSAVTTVSFKEFSEDYVNGNFNKRNYSLNQYLSLIIFLLIPITIGAIFLKEDVITIAFARGAFGINAVKNTVNVFVFYVLGIVFIAVREILSKYFYSTGNTKTPLINSAVAVGVNILLNIILSKYMKASGLALATTISCICACVLLFISARKFEKNFSIKVFIHNAIKIMTSSLIMMIVLLVFNHYIEVINMYVHFFINILIGVFIYFISSFVISRDMLKKLISLLVSSR